MALSMLLTSFRSVHIPWGVVKVPGKDKFYKHFFITEFLNNTLLLYLTYSFSKVDNICFFFNVGQYKSHSPPTQTGIGPNPF